MPNWFIKFMAPKFGTLGQMNYGMGFWPEGWYWAGYFVRKTPHSDFDRK